MPTISQGQIVKIFFNGYKGNLFAAEQLAQDMKRLIDEAVNEAARLCAGQGAGFDFRRHPVMRQRLEEIMQRLRQQMESSLTQGSKDAWLRAETTTSKVVEAMAMGNPKLANLLNAGLNVRQNDRALEAFQGRVMNGMRLSDRVWNLTAQTQAQIEQGIEIALAEGTPAAKLSRQVRNCLQNPDNFFRRFKYKVRDEPLFDEHGKPILDSTGKQATRPVYGRKWKRRYVDADGNTRWQDVNLDDYSYGRGVYRSSYKNAMRMARTEVNMAYQASDHERWKRSWWVKGIRVGLSNNHPMPDICNDLAGDYPADFKFIGWHPQCRCFAHAITATSEEIQDYYRRKRAGEDMTDYKLPGTVTEPPQGFKDWMSTNGTRLDEAHARGKTPYFVADNSKYTGSKYAPKAKPTTGTEAPIETPETPATPNPEPPTQQEPREMTIQERAAARHAARTEEETERIQLAWDAHRREEYETRMQNQLSLAEYDKIKTDLYDVDCGMFGDHDSNRRILDEMRRKLDVHKSNLDIWNDLLLTTPNKRKDVIPPMGSLDFFDEKTSTILRAAKRHASRTDKEIATIRKAWNLHRIEDGKRILAGTPTPEQALAAKLKISDATIRNFEKAKEITDYLEKQYPGIGIHMDGMDIETIREFALSADSHFIRFPGLTSKFKQLGSISWEYDTIVQAELDKRVADRINALNNGKAVLSGKKPRITDLGQATKDGIRAQIETEKAFIDRSPAGNTSTYAYSDPWDKHGTNGIYWNESRNFKKATESVKKDVKSKYHPEGCDSVRAIFDHEFGHKVDEYLGLRTNPEFIKIYDAEVAKGKKHVTDSLSSYAWTGKDPKAEFIAEAWSEYVCSPSPRPIAKKIGELIEKLAAAKTP